MKRKSIFKSISMLVLLAFSLTILASCSKDGKSAAPDINDVTKISFKETAGFDYLKSLDDKYVTINGYMATNSPVDGSFIFLMNLPYQNCPFCVPNTSQLSNTIEIYPEKGETFAYTTQAIKVVGKLEVAESEDKPFTDSYGYEFCCKIVDATYSVIKSEELSEEVALWQKIADSDVVNDVYQMYDYLNFLCTWDTCFVKSYTNENGEIVPGYYLYASDAERYIYSENGKYNYGYKDGYFDSIVEKIEAVDKNAFAGLVANVRKAQTIAEKALSDLENQNYTSEYKYIEKFGVEDWVFTLNNGDELSTETKEAYNEFSDWLGSWEM